ncbi:MAG: hypothetical protein E6Q97_31400 [Desulfurellales bacterium]|nr:MAG: hypothetical protein E6Q97_31400 [Desulfurellales bacterium]
MTAFRSPVETTMDRTGTPLRTRFFFFVGDTDEALPVYSDIGRSTQLLPPILTDAAGRRPVVYLPYATDGMSTYRVRCEDLFGSVVYEALLPLPEDSGSPSGDASSGWALSLLTERTDGGDLVLMIDAASFGGLLSVSATVSNVRVVLPAFADTGAGRSMVVEQIGLGAAVIVEAPVDGKFNGRYAAWSLKESGESATFVRGSASFRVLSSISQQMVIPVAARSSTPPSLPLPGDFYLATATGTKWTAGRIYRSDGAGDWIEFVPRAGMIAVVVNETVSGSPRPYCFSGIGWVAWSPVLAADQVFVGEYRLASGLPGGIPSYGVWTPTLLNYEEVNSVADLTLSSGRVNMPAGSFDVEIQRYMAATMSCAIGFWSTAGGVGFRSLNTYSQGETHSLDVVSGNITDAPAGGDVSLQIRVGNIVSASMPLVLDEPTTFELQYYANTPLNGSFNTDLGAPMSISGQPEIYARVKVRRR